MEIQARRYTIVPDGFTYVQPIGVYSRKVKSIDALPQNATIGVPNDPATKDAHCCCCKRTGLLLPADGHDASGKPAH